MHKLPRDELEKAVNGPRDASTAEGFGPVRQRAIVIVPIPRQETRRECGTAASGLTPQERLDEATGLTNAIALEVVFAGLAPFSHPRPATLFGSGKVEEFRGVIAAHGADVVIVDHPLSPIQQRNLEKAWNAKVLDRTGLILEIFGDRAQTKEGRLQVELAHLTWQKSRLVRSWTHLERQRGGFGFLGGPGETQIEADRRVIAERIDAIRAELENVRQMRRLHRKRRKVNQQQTVALVGYTNAGKSTLFNALTGARAFAEDMLFATLDPTMRRVRLGDAGSFILSDTVGFISELPPQLIAAFRATLEEIGEADLILHVRDIASSSRDAQKADVESVLSELGVEPEDAARRIIEVWNKADLLPAEEEARLRNLAARTAPRAVLLSARTGEGLTELLALIRETLHSGYHVREVICDSMNGPLINWIYENGQVLNRHDHQDGRLHFTVRLAPQKASHLDQRIAQG